MEPEPKDKIELHDVVIEKGQVRSSSGVFLLKDIRSVQIGEYKTKWIDHFLLFMPFLCFVYVSVFLAVPVFFGCLLLRFCETLTVKITTSTGVQDLTTFGYHRLFGTSCERSRKRAQEVVDAVAARLN